MIQLSFATILSLNLDNLEWSKIETSGEIPEKGSKFSTDLINSEIYLFNGTSKFYKF